MRVATKVY